MAHETVSVSPGFSRSPASASWARWLVAGLTLLICVAVVARVPLWGAAAWGVHASPDFVGNLPLLVVLALVFGAHRMWERTLDKPEAKTASPVAKIALFCALALGVGLSARLGESAGLGRLAFVTINPASGGFFEAAYDSQNDPNWLANYPALMKKYHHVHSHPPMGVGVMRWWLAYRSPALTGATDNLLAVSPGTNSSALAQLVGRIWKRPYSADDIGAAFWGGLTWLLCALLVPACTYVSANALFGPRAALHGAALACAVPSLVLFVPSADLSYIGLASLALALAVTGIQRFSLAPVRSIALLAGGGIVAALAITGSFAGAWTILLTAIFLGLRKEGTTKNRAVQAGIFAGAALLALGVLRLMGMDWLLFWRSLIAFNVDPDVNPVLRFIYHLADFFTFLGVPISIALFVGLRRAASKRQKSSHETETEETGVANQDIVALVLPTLGVLLLLNTVISMAETARIWMLFMPPLLVAVGGILSRSESPSLPRWVLIAQLVQTWVFVVFLNVWSF